MTNAFKKTMKVIDESILSPLKSKATKLFIDKTGLKGKVDPSKVGLGDAIGLAVSENITNPIKAKLLGDKLKDKSDLEKYGLLKSLWIGFEREALVPFKAFLFSAKYRNPEQALKKAKEKNLIDATEAFMNFKILRPLQIFMLGDKKTRDLNDKLS